MLTDNFKDVSYCPPEDSVTQVCLQEERLRVVLLEIKQTKSEIEDILHKDILQGSQNGQRIQYFLHTIRVFQAEFCSHLKNWNELSQVLNVNQITGHVTRKLTFSLGGRKFWTIRSSNLRSYCRYFGSSGLSLLQIVCLTCEQWLDNSCPMNCAHRIFIIFRTLQNFFAYQSFSVLYQCLEVTTRLYNVRSNINYILLIMTIGHPARQPRAQFIVSGEVFTVVTNHLHYQPISKYCH